MAGGGTGGHVIPALAVARELHSRGQDVFFIGTDRGLESRLVPAEGFPLERIDIGGLNRVGIRQTLATFWRLPRSTRVSLRLLRTRKAAAVFSMGGYVAGPPVVAALLARIPVVVMEPNAIPGFTNRRIARFVTRALVSFPETSAYFPKSRTEITGLPVREQFFQLQRKPRGEVLSVLITGGSQGSKTLNEAARASWPLFQNAQFPIRFLHQTGRGNHEQLCAEFEKTGLAGEVVSFIGDMPAAFAQADLIVCRSGAGAVAEVAAAGKPTVLAPFPFAADDHQQRNAEAFERAGAARLVTDKEMTGQRLFDVVRELAGEPGRLERMGEAARKFAHPGAASRAAEILIDSSKRNRNNNNNKD
jgi:UDP-N-acetylglucosamine--N-acetylmuramyl-(pentapeptide) pyrophosphoryl-undecaprenol N-acetylglucosamine transferase